MTPATVPRPRPIVVHEVRETGETVLYDDEKRNLLVLNDLGSAVWYLLDGERDVKAIAREIVETLEADPNQVEQDIMAFLESLASRGLVELG